jgi:hypothetical protein
MSGEREDSLEERDRMRMSIEKIETYGISWL